MTTPSKLALQLICAFVFVFMLLTIFAWANMTYGEDSGYVNESSFCVAETYIQPDGSCLPIDATR